MQKIAAIDAGSNAMRMLVGNINEAGEPEPVENIRLPVRLGQDVFASGVIQEKTIQQAVDAFLHFRRVADRFGVARIRAIATSAMREAANSDILVDRIYRTSGIQLDTISGVDEARLIHLAVTHALSLRGKRAVLIDIGGGSVEVTISEDANIVSTESYDMGTVRLLQKLDGAGQDRFPSHLIPKPFGLLVREYAEAPRRRLEHEIGSAQVHLCIGTGGNVEDLGRLHQRIYKKPNDRLVTLSELRDLIEQLDRMSVEQRIRKFKLRPDRADVILPAAIVLQLIAHEAHIKEVTIPHVGLKDGVLLEMACSLKRDPGAPQRAQIWESAMRLGEKFQFDAGHAMLTAKLARQLFDQTGTLHALGEEEGLLLEVAALLHDIGHFIGTIDHDKHGYYILKANRLIGLNEHQQEILANLVRYHRRTFPSIDDVNFRTLPQKDRMTVNILSALLRLADGMDVRHASHVTHASLERRNSHWRLTLRGRGDLMLEQWALNKRRSLFEEIFGTPLDIVDARV